MSLLNLEKKEKPTMINEKTSKLTYMSSLYQPY